MPLVRYVGGTWRVGGIVALSRAFGDAYLKGSPQFEGVRAGGDGYSSGFGVVCEPETTLIDLTCAHFGDNWSCMLNAGFGQTVDRLSVQLQAVCYSLFCWSYSMHFAAMPIGGEICAGASIA